MKFQSRGGFQLVHNTAGILGDHFLGKYLKIRTCKMGKSMFTLKKHQNPLHVTDTFLGCHCCLVS